MAANDNDPELAEDLLRGAKEIAIFLYGSPNFRRRVFHLIATSKLPHFKLGSMICARKSVLLHWIKQQEERHANDNCMPSCANKRSA
jgi:hypothetical protein